MVWVVVATSSRRTSAARGSRAPTRTCGAGAAPTWWWYARRRTRLLRHEGDDRLGEGPSPRPLDRAQRSAEGRVELGYLIEREDRRGLDTPRLHETLDAPDLLGGHGARGLSSSCIRPCDCRRSPGDANGPGGPLAALCLDYDAIKASSGDAPRHPECDDGLRSQGESLEGR